MDLALKGKGAVVTAASRGIGRAVAFGLAANGARVAVCARDAAPLEKTAEEISALTGSDVLAIPADVNHPEEIRRLVAMAAAAFGDLHLLVNNAVGPLPGESVETTDAQWQVAFEANLLAAIRLSREMIPHMKRAGGGRIVNVMSISVERPVGGPTLSIAVESAMVGLAKTMANQLGRDRITVNTVCPGRILTERCKAMAADWAAAQGRSLEEFLKLREAEIPLRRYGMPEEVAHLVVFLASDPAGYITGATIQIDGGLMKGLN